ncbi:MAG TPA: hypothetical protein VFJ58_17590 [Armatimonadota bacterium]|nr:hypothetical protein [Armatimonadota bacterium]
MSKIDTLAAVSLAGGYDRFPAGLRVAVGAILICCSLSPARCAAVKQEDRDLDTVRTRLIESLLPAAPSQLASTERAARADADSLQADGSWKDIDYADKSPANWKAAAHLSRLGAMARAYRAPGSALHGQAELKRKALSALDYWLQNDPANPNWWWNQIGAPQSLGQILLLLAPDLKAEEIRSGVTILHRSDMERVNGKIAARWTGANLVWMAGNEIMRGLLENDRATVAGALDAIYGEIRITPPGAEGIQPDFSFHQHGALLYSAGYGAAFTEDCADYAYLTRGTGFSMPPDRLRIL